jgi:uncharacterized protein YebE (UPF0316 family)
MDHMALASSQFFDSALVTWVIVPLFIFSARVMDVSLGTMRIIFLSRGRKLIAPALGFFEVLIWLLAMRQIMQNLNEPITYIAYAAGFATGNFVGIYLESKLAIGTLIIRIITPKDTGELVAQLHAAGYGVTSVDGRGAVGPVKLIYIIIKRKDLAGVVEIITRCHPKAFLSIEEIRSASEGVFPPESPHRIHLSLSSLRQKRK